MATATRTFVVDPFCYKQFENPNNSVYIGGATTIAQFEAHINALYESGKAQLSEGYAPFCKHLFVDNFVGAYSSIVPITPENEALIQSDYEARTLNELPVLVRWLPASATAPSVAKYLDVIVYSREQIIKENAAMGTVCIHEEPWGIISVKPQDVPHELPMQPITMMRNALGKEHGGSGVELRRDLYEESVAFWKGHIMLR
eukprot:c13309_g1_i1.p1 GENE.c13309_g1_i1~~c13309_g1_i1.p1  ORF type:complete len:201 (+),score=41.46 c13309_g1_i1:73-675(+)